MTETQKKGIGKVGVGLAILAVLIVVFASLTIWFYYQVNNLKTARLIKINLEERDVRAGTPYLQVRSIVVNLGTNRAYNSKLHVVLYQGNTIAKETDIVLGSIEGGEWKVVDEKIYYVGSALTSYSVMPEWTS